VRISATAAATVEVRLDAADVMTSPSQVRGRHQDVSYLSCLFMNFSEAGCGWLYTPQTIHTVAAAAADDNNDDDDRDACYVT